MTIKHKHRHQDYDLYEDVEKIKAALIDTAQDMRGKAGEVFYDSVDNVKKQTNAFKENVGTFTAEKPFKSLGIALVTGAILGYLLHK